MNEEIEKKWVKFELGGKFDWEDLNSLTVSVFTDFARNIYLGFVIPEAYAILMLLSEMAP